MTLIGGTHPIMRRSVLLLLSLVFPLAACASADASADEKDTEATLQGGPAPAAVGQVKISGTVVDAVNRTAVVDATVAAGGVHFATTDSAGRFSFTAPAGLSERPTVTRAGYAQHRFETIFATGDADLGTLRMLPLPAQTLLRSYLNNYDPTLGAVSVRVLPRGACPTEGGATVSISPAGSSKIAYFRHGLPSDTATDVEAGEETSALVYNVATAQPLKLTVVRAGCSMAPYPVNDHGLTRTGEIVAYAGDSLTFATGFLE